MITCLNYTTTAKAFQRKALNQSFEIPFGKNTPVCLAAFRQQSLYKGRTPTQRGYNLLSVWVDNIFRGRTSSLRAICGEDQFSQFKNSADLIHATRQAQHHTQTHQTATTSTPATASVTTATTTAPAPDSGGDDGGGSDDSAADDGDGDGHYYAGLLALRAALDVACTFDVCAVSTCLNSIALPVLAIVTGLNGLDDNGGFFVPFWRWTA